MIALSKHPEPAILLVHGAEWLEVIKSKLARGEVPTVAEKTRYRHPEIKVVLKAETNGKCAYCESRLLHVSFGDVEHISPKSLQIEDTFKWSNLTLACDVCNTYKTSSVGLVDPYIDDPDNYFKFLGPLIYAIPEHPKAVITERQLRLNRVELIENRSKRLKAISSIILTIKRTADLQERQALLDDLYKNEASDESEYAAFVRSFIAVVLPIVEPAV